MLSSNQARLLPSSSMKCGVKVGTDVVSTVVLVYLRADP